MSEQNLADRFRAMREEFEANPRRWVRGTLGTLNMPGRPHCAVGWLMRHDLVAHSSRERDAADLRIIQLIVEKLTEVAPVMMRRYIKSCYHSYHHNHQQKGICASCGIMAIERYNDSVATHKSLTRIFAKVQEELDQEAKEVVAIDIGKEIEIVRVEPLEDPIKEPARREEPIRTDPVKTPEKEPVPVP